VLALKACVVTLKRPMRNRAAEAAKLLPRLDLWFVEAREINPPPGVPPLHWRLLTTHAVTSLADAKRVSGHHAQRWTIEQLFRVMKTKGFDVEAVRMADVVAFESLAAAILIAAVQMPQMVSDRDGINKRPPEDVFEPSGQPALEVICQTLEGKTAKQKNPPKGSLAYACWVCARPPPSQGHAGRLDRILWKARPRRHARRLLQLQSHRAGLDHGTTCVNLVSFGPVMTGGGSVPISSMPGPPLAGGTSQSSARHRSS
jgi:hypothetical protein